MGYTMATIHALLKTGVEIHVVHWDVKKQTPYRMPGYKNLYKYPRSTQNLDSLKLLAKKIDPEITVVSGWQDKTYLGVSLELRQHGHIVVSGFDDQWHGRLRQYIAATLGCFGFFSRYFSHAWVSGVYQYEYARKLGFKKQEIIYDLYSADLSLFHSAYQLSFTKKSSHYPHRFLFVGRFELIKGLEILLAAWKELGIWRRDWELHLIGNGSLKEKLTATPGIIINNFMQPDKLINEIPTAGCFILPSYGEPWGVVVHEFAAAGLPLILSDTVGASSKFMINGLNGFRFKNGDSKELLDCMRQIIEMNDEELVKMSMASHMLSSRITPETSAANLLGITKGMIIE